MAQEPTALSSRCWNSVHQVLQAKGCTSAQRTLEIRFNAKLWHMYCQPKDSFAARIYTDLYRIYGNIYLVQAGSTAGLLNAENRTHTPVTGPWFMPRASSIPPGQRPQSRYLLHGGQQNRYLLDGGRPSLGCQSQPSPARAQEGRVIFLKAASW